MIAEGGNISAIRENNALIRLWPRKYGRVSLKKIKEIKMPGPKPNGIELGYDYPRRM